MDKELLKRAASGAEPGHDALAIGIDIESSDNLPWSGNPSSESFYIQHFTGAEIAWCLRQPDPRLSFCGLWSAKEAAIKCGQEFAGLRPIEIEVLHDERGRPRLRPTRGSVQAVASDCVVSISYSGRTGVAVCFKNPLASWAPDSRPEAGSSPLAFNDHRTPGAIPMLPSPGRFGSTCCAVCSPF